MNYKRVFLVILDSVRKDDFLDIIIKRSFPELRNDFVYFKNCSSIYSNTFLSHYAIFFGDYLNVANNKCFPAQLKALGYNVRSYCNYAVLMGYPNKKYSDSKFKSYNRPSLTDMINDLGIEVNFNLSNKDFGKKIQDYYGAADDNDKRIPEKWKYYIKENKNKNAFTFLHFWSTHHNYGINEFLENKINGINYAQLAKNLVKGILNKDLTEKFIKKIYYKRIFEVINIYIKDLIDILKNNGIYDESLIIITADHGEGLGDIGYNCSKRFLPLYYIAKRNYGRFRKKILPIAPEMRKVFSCRWDRHTFFHNGDFKLQKQVPMFIKFPKQIFGGISYNKEISLFDIIHTINEFTGNNLQMNNKLGCPLFYLIKEGENAREKYKINKMIRESLN